MAGGLRAVAVFADLWPSTLWREGSDPSPSALIAFSPDRLRRAAIFNPRRRAFPRASGGGGGGGGDDDDDDGSGVGLGGGWLLGTGEDPSVPNKLNYRHIRPKCRAITEVLRTLSSVAAMAPTAMAPPACMAPATGALLQVFPWAAVSPRAGSYLNLRLTTGQSNTEAKELVLFSAERRTLDTSFHL